MFCSLLMTKGSKTYHGTPTPGGTDGMCSVRFDSYFLCLGLCLLHSVDCVFSNAVPHTMRAPRPPVFRKQSRRFGWQRSNPVLLCIGLSVELVANAVVVSIRDIFAVVDVGRRRKSALLMTPEK
ncbi:unnamed protein product, partial [Ectocarpus sp. 12 AP-2014]